MALSIEATFENGVFVPKTRPALTDHEKVRLLVEPLPSTAEEVIERTRHHRIQIDPELAREIASSPEFLPEES